MNQSSPSLHSSSTTPLAPTITVAYGDGIGPEIMDATLKVLAASGANLKVEEIQVGEQVYKSGVLSGISPDSWNTLRGNNCFLKAPITTPQGGGYKSLNVTIRKSLGLFANVRPVRAYSPFVNSHFPNMDVVVIRENEEDLYAGIEHQQTSEVVQCLKLITVPGCERIVRYAFEYARAHGRKKVTCMSKDNIMKHTDGLFHQVFDRISKEYSDIESDHYIIDIGSAMLADDPGRFDVVVTLNLYGDIISDITAQIAGSVGLGGSANIGQTVSMFEAIHGSAPDIAGQDIANPSGLLHGATMMLHHLGLSESATQIQNAWLKTLEDGIHTRDIFHSAFTKKKVGTQEFAQSVIDRLGETPQKLAKAEGGTKAAIVIPPYQPEIRPKTLKGVDAFLDWNGEARDPDVLGKQLETLAGPEFKLKMITNRGVKVYPGGLPETFCTDHWRCRFVAKDGNSDISYAEILHLLNRLVEADLNYIKIENLYEIDGQRAYSLGQGE
ncbi:MAG: NADP-dependent isocitrate dehydrogenase [Bacteroidota bacterium]